jgi:hypothetical protein
MLTGSLFNKGYAKDTDKLGVGHMPIVTALRTLR